MQQQATSPAVAPASNPPQAAVRTPGPWEVRPNSNPGNGDAWRDIVSLGVRHSPAYVGEAMEQDAHLIASAPELLDALKNLSGRLAGSHEMWPELHTARAAIAKATGGAA